ncbi:hypothetical protein KSD_49950 [Ktedonobacter sp. SOSP1-85]|nr:hypothetical protein KSD_49950 [Ktedonobacter sp. SOSP1-85]
MSQALTLHPTHPLAEIFSYVNDDGSSERTHLYTRVISWSSQLQCSPRTRFYKNQEHTQYLLLQRRTAYALLGAPEQARQDLHALAEHSTSDLMEGLSCLVLAILTTEQDRYPEAHTHWERALMLLQPYKNTRDLLACTWYYAKVLIQLRCLDKAHRILTDILLPATHHPGLPRQEERAEAYAELYAQRGGVCSLLHFHQEAIEDLNAALELQPTCPRFFSIRGLLHAKQQHWQAAYQDLWRALHEMPEDQELADCLFVVMQRLGTQLVVPTSPAIKTKGRAAHE